MPLRKVHLWTLAAGVALALLLVGASQPGFAAGAGAGMSAPAPPARSIESAPAAKVLDAPFDGHAFTLWRAGLSLSLVAVGTRDSARPDRGSRPAHYGPLHRRPPPNFS